MNKSAKAKNRSSRSAENRSIGLTGREQGLSITPRFCFRIWNVDNSAQFSRKSYFMLITNHLAVGEILALAYVSRKAGRRLYQLDKIKFNNLDGTRKLQQVGHAMWQFIGMPEKPPCWMTNACFQLVFGIIFFFCFIGWGRKKRYWKDQALCSTLFLRILFWPTTWTPTSPSYQHYCNIKLKSLENCFLCYLKVSQRYKQFLTVTPRMLECTNPFSIPYHREFLCLIPFPTPVLPPFSSRYFSRTLFVRLAKYSYWAEPAKNLNAAVRSYHSHDQNAPLKRGKHNMNCFSVKTAYMLLLTNFYDR